MQQVKAITRQFVRVNILLVFVIFALVYCLATCARAHDGNHDHDAWFRSLKNKAGGLCCDGTDAKRLEDVDWREEQDGTYSVKFDGEWVHIDKDHVVTQPNIFGYAMVWIFGGKLTCFMPGQKV